MLVDEFINHDSYRQRWMNKCTVLLLVSRDIQLLACVWCGPRGQFILAADPAAGGYMNQLPTHNLLHKQLSLLLNTPSPTNTLMLTLTQVAFYAMGGFMNYHALAEDMPLSCTLAIWVPLAPFFKPLLPGNI
jgi:hypothetical protein